MKSKRPAPPDGYREIEEVIKDHEAIPKHAAALCQARARFKILLKGVPPLTKEGKERMEAAARVRNDSGKYPEIREIPKRELPDN